MQLKFEKIGMKNLRLSKKLHFLRNISNATTKATERVSATNDCSVSIKFLEDVEHTKFFVSGTFFSRTCCILFSIFSGQYNVFPLFPKPGKVVPQYCSFSHSAKRVKSGRTCTLGRDWASECPYPSVHHQSDVR
jgi:hypothetical protein